MSRLLAVSCTSLVVLLSAALASAEPAPLPARRVGAVAQAPAPPPAVAPPPGAPPPGYPPPPGSPPAGGPPPASPAPPGSAPPPAYDAQPLQYEQPAPATGKPSGGSRFRLEIGGAQRKVYDIPFWGGELRLGVGGRVGEVRMHGIFGLLLAKDDTELTLREFTGGLLIEGNAGPVILGGSVQLGIASISARDYAPTALGLGLGAHLGFDLAKLDSGGAVFVVLRGTANVYDGREAQGPWIFGPNLSVGFRL